MLFYNGDKLGLFRSPMLCFALLRYAQLRFALLFACAFREFLKNAYNKFNLREILIRCQ